MMDLVAPPIVVAGVKGCMGLGGKIDEWTHGESAGSTLLWTIGADWKGVEWVCLAQTSRVSLVDRAARSVVRVVQKRGVAAVLAAVEAVVLVADRQREGFAEEAEGEGRSSLHERRWKAPAGQ